MVDEPLPEPGEGEFLVRHIYLSLDPYQRSAMAGRHMAGRQPLGAGDMPAAETLGQVVRSRHPGLRGRRVRPPFRRLAGIRPVDRGADRAGRSGARAAVGLARRAGHARAHGLGQHHRTGRRPRGADGAGLGGAGARRLDGRPAGHPAGRAGRRHRGLRREVRDRHPGVRLPRLRELPADGFLDALRAALPDGADIYHDNVGGQMLADAFSVLKVNGTVILCGLMERYNDPAKSKPLDLALPILKRAVMKGLVVSDFEHRRPVFEAAVAAGHPGRADPLPGGPGGGHRPGGRALCPPDAGGERGQGPGGAGAGRRTGRLTRRATCGVKIPKYGSSPRRPWTARPIMDSPAPQRPWAGPVRRRADLPGPAPAHRQPAAEMRDDLAGVRRGLQERLRRRGEPGLRTERPAHQCVPRVDPDRRQPQGNRPRARPCSSTSPRRCRTRPRMPRASCRAGTRIPIS